MSRVRTSLLVAALAAAGAAQWVSAAQKPKAYTAPETFTSPLQAHSKGGSAAATIRIQIDRYTPEADRPSISDALKHGGYPNFLVALRKAPVVGAVEVGDVKVPVRWAREQPTAKGGRDISVVTESPVHFVGGGRADAKPRTGFEIAVVRLTVDELGLGTGTMAAAAKVKPDGQGGVSLEDYAEEPIKLTFVQRAIK